MKPKHTLRNFLALAGSSLLAISSAHAATRWFDGGTVDIGTNGNGASTGGTGTWNTTILNWDAGASPHVAWNNANADDAVIAGSGTLTVGVPVTVGALTLSYTSGTRTISGSEITINNGITFGNPAGLQFQAAIKLGGDQTWTIGGTNSSGKSISGGTNLNGHTLTWTGGLTNNGSPNHSDITGNGSIIKNGAGNISLSGTNTYTGSTTINSGNINAQSATALGNANNQLTVNTGGTLNMGSQSLSIGNLTGTGGLITGSSGTRTLTIGSGDNGGGNFQGVIENGSGGTTALTKTGNAAITLSGTNTYTGATLLSAGTLLVNGALGNTAVTANAGTFGGTGALAGNVTINAANFAPGASPGSLEIAGNLSLTASSTALIELGGTAFDLNVTEEYDRTKLTGAASILTLGGGALNVSALVSLAANQAFGIFQLEAGATRTGTFAGLLTDGSLVGNFGGQDLFITYSGDFGDSGTVSTTGGNDIVLYTVIPEPSTALLGAFGLLALLRRRR